MIVQKTDSEVTLSTQELAEGLDGNKSRTKSKKSKANLSRTRSKSDEFPASDEGNIDNGSDGVETGSALATSNAGSTAMAHPSSNGGQRKKVKPVAPVKIETNQGATDARQAHGEMVRSAENMADAAIAAFHTAYNRRFQEGVQEVVTQAIPESYAIATSVFDDLAEQLYGGYLVDNQETIEGGNTNAIEGE